MTIHWGNEDNYITEFTESDEKGDEHKFLAVAGHSRGDWLGYIVNRKTGQKRDFVVCDLPKHNGSLTMPLDHVESEFARMDKKK